MNKTNSLLLFFLLLSAGSWAQSPGQPQSYLRIDPNPANAQLFQMASGNFLEYFLADSVRINEQWYFVKMRQYGNGKTDTTYYREDEHNFYHHHSKSQQEAVAMPKQPQVGQQWFEPDSSWSYTILSLDAKLKTPTKRYRDLLLMECKQLSNRDPNKHRVYYLYYARGIGHVGSEVNGVLSSYLSKSIQNAKDGEVLEGKKTQR